MFYNLKIKEKKKCDFFFFSCYNDNGDVMKIALISDVHSNLLALKKAIKDIKNSKVDEVFFLGDYITDGPDSNEVLDIVKEYGNLVVLGNREKSIINYNDDRKEFNNVKPMDFTYHELNKENIDYIKTLPDKKIVKIGKYKVLIWHGDELIDRKGGLLSDFDEIIEKFDFDICIFGHTHVYQYLTYKDHIFLNPGSIGMPFDGPFYKYIILDIDEHLHVSLRQFDIQNDYDEIKEKYETSDYYKKNKIWADLILKEIKNGKCYVSSFINFINRKVKLENKITPDVYNEIWNRQYQHFLNNYNEINSLEIRQMFNANLIGTSDDLYRYIHDNITFGWMDVTKRKHTDLNSLYYLQTPMDLLRNRLGISLDVVELIRSYFNTFVSDIETYYFCSKNDFFLSHSIFVYYEKNKVYWFEPFLENNSGIFEYDTIDELLKDAEEKIEIYLKEDEIDIYLYNELKYYINQNRIEKYIKEGIKIK